MKFIVTTFLVTVLVNAQLGFPYTIFMSDASVPLSGLVDEPQPGSPESKVGARTDPIEQEAVYDIMRATGNDWAIDIPDVCHSRWHGIECKPDKDNIFHVVSLSFGSLSVDTAFPTCNLAQSFISPSIINLPHLRTLFFYRCFNENPQPVPSFLGRLGSSLQTLVLRENGHIGPIPQDLGNLTHLTVLDLHKNNLNSSIPVSLERITGLRYLDLSCNRLSGSVPNISFSKLNVLDLNQNHLTGNLPIPLLNTKSLIKVDLSRNRISGPIPNLRPKDLILLDLSYNSLTDPLPESLEDLKSLQALILSGNPSISTTIPEKIFDSLNNLMILGLSNMNLEGPIPGALGRLPMLRVLHMDGNHLNGTIPRSFSNLNALSELRLDRNKLTGPIPFGGEKVRKMGRKLRLDSNVGLCYDQKSGLAADDLDTLSSAGIGLCDATRNGPAASVQHISTLDNSEGWKPSRKESSGAEKITLFTTRLGLSFVMILFVSCLL
ncbi:hypothetical protein OROGR_011783 [Orobanche gracilis]